MNRVVVNEAMHIEYRQRRANGNKSKTDKTRVREVNFEVPQVRVGGLYHCAGGGSCSRYEWAKAILDLDPHKEEQIVKQLLTAKSSDFPVPAVRPMVSVLDNNSLSSRLCVVTPFWLANLSLDLGQ